MPFNSQIFYHVHVHRYYVDNMLFGDKSPNLMTANISGYAIIL